LPVTLVLNYLPLFNFEWAKIRKSYVMS